MSRSIIHPISVLSRMGGTSCIHFLVYKRILSIALSNILIGKHDLLICLCGFEKINLERATQDILSTGNLQRATNLKSYIQKIIYEKNRNPAW